MVFGDGTNINVAKGNGITGANSWTSWVVNNHGSVTGTNGVVLGFISVLNNTGTIRGTTTDGVSMTGGGLFTNTATGSIYGGPGSAGWGVVTATTGGGYGSVDDAFTNHGLIQGGAGGVQLAGWSRAYNDGTIQGGQIGIQMNGGGALNNAGSITGTSQTGILLKSPMTVTDSGTITGGVNAVQFTGAGANTLILQTGAVVNGGLAGSTAAGATNALTLNSSGILTGAIQHFDTLLDKGPGTWILDGASTLGSASVQASAGLQIGDASHPHASLTLTGGLQNFGQVQVDGSLDVQGAVTGTGSLFIVGAVVELESSVHQAIQFGGPAGLLELDHSLSFTGTVAGPVPVMAMDLQDIAYVGPNQAAFKGTATGGTLQVKDGVNTARIAMSGNYLASTWTTASDGHGGTLVYDPAAESNTQLQALIHSALGVALV